MPDQRPLVVEHRISTDYFAGARVYRVRYWIEGNPEHGGIESHKGARESVAAAQSLAQVGRVYEIVDLAQFLLEHVPAANSVEVCTPDGNGTAVHRDWP